MPRIVECVPNFSEGITKEVIEEIAAAINAVEGCTVLDIDPGSSTNRTVYTFVGSPEAVVEGALYGARAAYQLIDMRSHKGEHPRFGSLDVCPFIPVQDVTMQECVECAEEFGRRMAEELEVPVYLYGHAAKDEARKNLSNIRAGEYEGLEAKLAQPEWKPDYGPSKFVPTWGATAVGARKFLIAYNVNLMGTKEQAHRIALDLREQGRGPQEPGKLKSVQAIGWYLDEANLAQISANLQDYQVTGLHTLFEEAKQSAEGLKLAVCGSQIVGLVPLESILQAADYYIEKENLFILEDERKIRLVIDRLGLNCLGYFEPQKRIIEFIIKDGADDGPLASMSLKSFVLSVGTRSSTPGGGSVSAAIGALGAALAAMVGWLTYGNKKYYPLDSEMRQLIPPLDKAMKDLIPLIDQDTMAFDNYMLSLKLPKSTEEEKTLRAKYMGDAIKNAVNVPMKVAQVVNLCWAPMMQLAKIGNIQCKSDLQVGARALETAVWGAHYNVSINLPEIQDEEFKNKVKDDIDKALKLAMESREELLKLVDERKE